ncbi:hypothetical protein HX071_18130 [Myroides marinus]|nr:hypothetical protein [Myroides marinus]MDM1504090.1 hypothetical protein [Myroides marinus]
MNKEDLLKSIGRNVKQARELKGLSQVELVGLMEVDIPFHTAPRFH